jgi:cysteine synthase
MSIFQHPSIANTTIYFKNEAASITGSLKHRYAWALFMWALVDGHINPDTTVYEASSGNTAASEAYMAHLIGVRFFAVVAANAAPEKVAIIRYIVQLFQLFHENRALANSAVMFISRMAAGLQLQKKLWLRIQPVHFL